VVVPMDAIAPVGLVLLLILEGVVVAVEQFIHLLQLVGQAGVAAQEL
jgi:hypothetical protein